MSQPRRTDPWDPPAPSEAATTLPDGAPDWTGRADEVPAAAPRGRIVLAILLALAAIAWLALVAAGEATGDARLMALAGRIALACVPLALIASLYLILRGGNALRFGGNAAQLDGEVRALDRSLAGLADQLAADRALVTDHARLIAAAGAEASGRLAETSAAMRVDADLLARERQAMEYAAAAARTDLGALLEGMPQVGAQAEQVAQVLQAAGADTDARIRALQTALAGLSDHARNVDEQAGGAADRLSERLTRIEAAGTGAGRALDDLAGTMGRTVDDAMAHAAEMIERGRAGIDAQAAAMRALVEQARAALSRAGSETADTTEARLAAALAQVDAIGTRLAAQDAAATDLIGGLNAGLRAIEGRFADLGEAGTAEGARLAATVQSVAAYAEQVREGLVVGGDAADALVRRAEALAERLEGPARQLHEVLPEAFGRIEQQARRSLTVLGEATPHITRLDGDMAGLAGRLDGIAATLTAQAEASNALVAEIDRRLAATLAAARDLDGAIGEASGNATKLAEGSTATLIDAMIRVRETAAQAAERAREAIAAVIPDSAAAMARASSEALSDSVSRAVDDQVARLTTMAEAATGTAQRAADRLAGQMLTLAETTATMEARLTAVRADEEERAHDNFPRRAAHLIDALNSAAIDVAKILSNEVTDTVWAAYLKGDRGIFTRRAVRLVDGADQREIIRLYGEDAEFRDQVSRYVHDFEALLRPVMGSRDGAPLAVTLLGSDMGKLYVALAQSISRLRG